MPRRRPIVPITALCNELQAEIVEINTDLARLQKLAREAGNWKMEFGVLDRRLKLIELRLREVREHSLNVMNVNFDVDTRTAEKMALAFLARQRQIRDNGNAEVIDAK